MKYIPITPEGFAKLQQEIQDLQHNKMPEIVKVISEAASHGDLSENAEYSSAKEKQAILHSRIMALRDMLGKVRVMYPTDIKDKSCVRFGAIVTVLDLDNDKSISYKLLSEIEADPLKNIISISSPLGNALLSKKKGDIVDFRAPAGLRSLEIRNIKYE